MNTFNFPSTRWPVFARPIPDLMSELLSSQGQPSGATSARSLPVNAWSDGKALHIEAELPGLAIEDIELTVLQDELTLKGTPQPLPDLSERDDESTMLLEERRSGAFERRLKLPVEVKADDVTAELRNGVLLVTLPRSEAELPRRIQVRSSGE